VIELRGRFVCNGCTGPRGSAAPTGDVRIEYVDAATLSGVGGGFGDTWYDLDRLGNSFPLIAPPGGLTPLQQHPQMVPFVGKWTSRSGTLIVTVTGGQLTYGGVACPVPAGRKPACSSISLVVSGFILRSLNRRGAK
jgi:hypothetical protein